MNAEVLKRARWEHYDDNCAGLWTNERRDDGGRQQRLLASVNAEGEAFAWAVRITGPERGTARTMLAAQRAARRALAAQVGVPRKIRSIRHTRFAATTPGGNTVQVYGDPYMEPETLEALGKMFDLAYQQLMQQQ